MKFSGVSAAALSTFVFCASTATAQDYPQQAYAMPGYAPPTPQSAPPQYITPQHYPQALMSPVHQSELPPMAPAPTYYGTNPAPTHSYAPPVHAQSYAAPVHTAPTHAQPYAAPVHTAPTYAQPYAAPVHTAPTYAQPYAAPAYVTTYPVAPPHSYTLAIIQAPATVSAPTVRKLSKREREDSIKRCNFADDSIGHALNSYSQLLHKQLPYDSAKHYENQMQAQTYNLRNHIRSIKHSGNSEICEYESDMALKIIHAIYQYR
ncbi:hypothetical protein [Asticcacaulis tiandongensis]|uniref:hypothetical protein n=1 Tax=Asticcacaulis tiandongensis TaxID=2565365 RepID=UPI001127B4CF|nr:hypothetical protein [Asticcacaulis tiandongensis]